MRLETISQPIKAMSIEEHERMLNDRMTAIKLEYIDLILSKSIPLLEGEDKEVSEDDIVSLLNRYTPVLRELMRCYVIQRENEGVKWEPEMYDPAASQFKDKIDEFRKVDHDHWIEKTMQLVKEEQEKIKGITVKKSSATEEGYDEEDEGGENKNIAGIINFNIEMIEADSENWFKPFGSIAKRGDSFISIHLEPLYKQAQQSGSPDLSLSGSLGKLAVQIITKYPETKAVIADSWIVDTPIARRIGLTIYAEKKYDRTLAFWGQFVNEKGQIDEARVKKFLETGQAPYCIATGAIMVEDFLKKYLPKEYKGRVDLKEPNPSFNLEEYEHDSKIFRDLGAKDWGTTDEAGLQNIFSQCPFMTRFNESDFGRGFFDFLIRLKREQKTKEQLAEEFKLANFRESMRKFLAVTKYIDKEVVIE